MRVLVHAFVVFCVGCTGSVTGPDVGETNSGPRDGERDEPDDVEQPVVYPLAAGISLDDMAINQAVQVMLVEDGEVVENRNASVVAGGSAHIMVDYNVEEGFVGRDITAELTVATPGAEPYVASLTTAVDGSHQGSVRLSPFSFAVPAGVLNEESTYSLAFKEVDPDADYPGKLDGARFPAEGGVELGAQSLGGTFRVVLVPFAYNADGSGRLPPLDEETMAEYRAFFGSMFPNAELDMSVREAVPYNGSIRASGGGWDSWLDRLADIRAQDDPPENSYYYGFAAPRSTFGSYCSGGCVAGLGFVPRASEEGLRVSVGISFTDDIGVYTAMHEVGHTLGRPHAPCGGPAGVDPSYPYRGASVGVWGYDQDHETWKDPDRYTDIMGYCNTQWISDYTFNRVFNRLVAVNELASEDSLVIGQSYRVGLVDGAGDVRWSRETTLKRPLVGRDAGVELLDARGRVTGQAIGQFVPYDHLPGGAVYVPLAADETTLRGASRARLLAAE